MSDLGCRYLAKWAKRRVSVRSVIHGSETAAAPAALRERAGLAVAEAERRRRRDITTADLSAH